MKHKIKQLISDYPRHYSKMIRGDDAMNKWVVDNSLIGTDDFAAAIYSAMNQVSNKCKNGNIKKFKNYTIGFIGCGTAAQCACTKEAIAENVKKTKSTYTDEQKADIQTKRESTTLERFGVTNIMKIENPYEERINQHVTQINDKNDIQQLLSNGSTIKQVLTNIRLSNQNLYSDVNTAESLYLYMNDMTHSPTCVNGHPLRFTTYEDGYAKNCKSNCNNTQAQSLKDNWSQRSDDEKSALFDKMKQTNIERYGVDNVMHSDVVKDKLKETNLEKYGVEFPFQSEEIQEKCANTMLEKYGVRYVGESPELQEKRKSTCIEKYGVDNTMSIARDAYKEQTGYDHYFCDPANQKKNKAIWMERYGVDHPMKSKRFRDKAVITSVSRYNRKHPTQKNWTDHAYDVMTDESKFEDMLRSIGVYKMSNDLGIDYKTICRYVDYYDLNDVSGVRVRSRLESDFENYLNELGFYNGRDYCKDDRFVLGNNKEIDFYFPKLNLAFELDGVWFHAEKAFGKSRTYHSEKTDICESKGIQLVSFWEDEWKFKNEIVKEKVKTLLGISKESIGARKCTIDVTSWNEEKQFLTDHHIQGFTGNRTGNFCLKYGADIVAVMVYQKVGNVIEITRYATSKRANGGFTKLMKHMLAQNPDVISITSWADRRVSNGNMYAKNGFMEEKRIAPDYYYVKNINRYRKEGFRKEKLKKKYNLSDEDMQKTEWQICQELGYDRVWDNGKILYRYTVDKNKK